MQNNGRKKNIQIILRNLTSIQTSAASVNSTLYQLNLIIFHVDYVSKTEYTTEALLDQSWSSFILCYSWELSWDEVGGGDTKFWGWM